MKEREIVKFILLMLFTFGIYAIYWMYTFHKEVREQSGEGADNLKHLLGMFLTFGIYPIYWVYVTNQRLARISNGKLKDESALRLILCFVGLGVVSFYFMQNDANMLASESHSA